jgi:uncharacterized membrane protein YgcG
LYDLGNVIHTIPWSPSIQSFSSIGGFPTSVSLGSGRTVRSPLGREITITGTLDSGQRIVDNALTKGITIGQRAGLEIRGTLTVIDTLKIERGDNSKGFQPALSLVVPGSHIEVRSTGKIQVTLDGKRLNLATDQWKSEGFNTLLILGGTDDPTFRDYNECDKFAKKIEVNDGPKFEFVAVCKSSAERSSNEISATKLLAGSIYDIHIESIAPETSSFTPSNSFTPSSPFTASKSLKPAGGDDGGGNGGGDGGGAQQGGGGSSESKDDKDKLEVGAVVGIAIGVAVLVGIVTAVICCLVLRSKDGDEESSGEDEDDDGSSA